MPNPQSGISKLPLLIIYATAACVSTNAQTTAFTYQDKLTNSAAAAQGRAATAEQLIRDLYALHDADLKGARGDRLLDGESRRYLDKIFAKHLADLIWKDLKTHREEVGVIDFDLFYNSQDPHASNLRIHAVSVTNRKATVHATFDDESRRQTIIYLLTKENGAWKIANISYGKGENLLKYFREQKPE